MTGGGTLKLEGGQENGSESEGMTELKDWSDTESLLDEKAVEGSSPLQGDVNILVCCSNNRVVNSADAKDDAAILWIKSSYRLRWYCLS